MDWVFALEIDDEDTFFQILEKVGCLSFSFTQSLDPLSLCAHEWGGEEAQMVPSDLPGLNPKQRFFKCFLLKWNSHCSGIDVYLPVLPTRLNVS